MKKLMQNEKGGVWLWVLLAVVIGVVAFLALRQPALLEQPAGLPETAGPVLSEEDTTAAIEEELQATDLGNLDEDIKALDADINQL